MGHTLEKLEMTATSAIMCGMIDILFSLLLLLIRDKRASFWWIFDEACVLTICWPTVDAETCSLGSTHKDVLWVSAQIYPAKHGAVIAPDWQDGELLLQSCQRLRSCVMGVFEIVIKEKWSALVVKAIMRWAVLTLQCRDPTGSTGGPFYCIREISADPLWFLCVLLILF